MPSDSCSQTGDSPPCRSGFAERPSGGVWVGIDHFALSGREGSHRRRSPMKLCADCLLRSSRRGIFHGMPAKTIAFCRAFGFSVTRSRSAAPGAARTRFIASPGTAASIVTGWCAGPLADQAEDRSGTPANRLLWSRRETCWSRRWQAAVSRPEGRGRCGSAPPDRTRPTQPGAPSRFRRPV